MSTELKSLPVATVRLIGSSQVITSVFSVVKEILENSLDAEATSVEIKLENYGLDKIEVRDNGVGIKQCNIPLVTKRYHTSKITSFSDLDCLVTYGFRGEALGSLCAVSNLSITSKTADEDVSHCVSFDCHGNVTSEVPSHLGQGTTICASHLFKNMPVRRQFYNSAKKKKEELKKVEDLLMWYGAIRPGTRLSLRHGKDLIWQKNIVVDVRSALLGVLGRSVVSQLEVKKMKTDNPEVTIEAYLPRSNSDVQITSRSTSDRSFIAVNDRPVYLKDLDKCIRQHYCQHHRCESRHPVYFLSINCPSSQLDVNVDPNKTRVMLHHQKDIIAILRECLESLYGPLIKLIEAECDDDMKMNGSVTASGDHSELHSDDSDESFVQHQTVSSKAGTEQNKLKKQFNNNNHSTNKISKHSESKGHEDSAGGEVAGFRISFYDHHKNRTDGDGIDNNDKITGLDQNENEREKPYEILTDHNKNKTDGDCIELNDKTTGLDQNENEREKPYEILTESVIINGESDDIGLTQVVGKGCFDLVDDFDSLLESQQTNFTKDFTKDSKETGEDIFEPRHEISNNVVCATSKGSDQPAHTLSLIRAFASG